MVYSVFLLGLLGSWHCIGMCGPIGMVIPVPREKRIIGFFIYHSGRIGLYAAFGALLGFVGYSAALFEVQRTATLVMGVVVIAISVAPFLSKGLKQAYFSSSLMRWVKAKTVAQFQNKTLRSSFLAGTLNGFLPCGLIYLAGAAAMMADTLQEGAAMMGLFGLGTLPGLFAVWMVPNLRLKTFSSAIPKLAPVFSLLMGLLLIYRGLSVEMPMLDTYLGTIGFRKITICQ